MRQRQLGQYQSSLNRDRQYEHERASASIGNCIKSHCHAEEVPCSLRLPLCPPTASWSSSVLNDLCSVCPHSASMSQAHGCAVCLVVCHRLVGVLEITAKEEKPTDNLEVVDAIQKILMEYQHEYDCFSAISSPRLVFLYRSG